MDLNLGISFINIVFILIAVFALVIISKAVLIVPQTQKFIIERFGKYNRTLSPGINVIIPIFDKVSKKVTVLERDILFPKSSVFTKDNVEVYVSAVVYYKISDAHKSVYQIEDLEGALQATIFGQLRSIFGGMDTDSILSERAMINNKISAEIKEASEGWGVHITRTEILDIDFSPKIKESMESQLTAERERRAAIIKSEGEKRSIELKADGEFYDVQKKADADLYQAQKQAEAVIVAAEAESQRIAKIGEAVKENGMEPLNFELAINQIKALEKLSSSNNAKLIFSSNEMTNTLGNIAGISDIWNSNKSMLEGNIPKKQG